MNPTFPDHPCISRRRFLSGLAACAGCAMGGALLGCHSPRSANRSAAKPKIRLVFCEARNDKPIWPNLGYDFQSRRQAMLSSLTQGCPGLELLPMVITDKPNQADEVLQADPAVDGYLICVQGLGWNNDISRLCATGKPTLLVDNLFGGSGMFLSHQPQIMHSGKPVDWVSSSNERHLVASTKHFELLAKGKTPTEIAAAFRAARRRNTPAPSHRSCTPDLLPQPNFDLALQQLHQTKILVIGGGWGGESFAKAARELTGVEFIALEYPELAAAYRAVDPQSARAFADRWMARAQAVVEPNYDDIKKSGTMYLAMKQLLDRYGARGISINCLGGFYEGHLEAYPCLGFSQLNDDGLVGGCEGDQMSALTMAVLGTVTGRPGFISDPVIDTAKNSIIYAHCVAPTKPFGPNQAAIPYRIRSHSEDRKGASIQSLLPQSYLTTTLELNPVSKQIVVHQAKAAGNNPSDMACRTKLEAVIVGDLEKLTENWRMGWHRVTFYGDLKDCVNQLGQRLNLQVIQEA